ncbi:MAG: tetratricopeptide repeat protein [Flavobacteriales bacterium]
MPKPSKIKPLLFILLIIGVLCLKLEASDKVDTLKSIIKNTNSDTTKIDAIIKLTGTLKYNNPDSAITLSKQALRLTKELNEKKEMAKLQHRLGVCHYMKSNYARALEFYFKSIKTKKEINYKKGIGISYSNIGIVYFKQSNYPKALEYYFKGLEIHKEMDDTVQMSSSYHNIGGVYHRQGNFSKALEYYFKSLKNEKKRGNKFGMAKSYNNLGIIKEAQNKYKECLNYYFKALEIRKKINNKRAIAQSYTNLGSLLSSISEEADSTKKMVLRWIDNMEGWKKEGQLIGNKKEQILSLAEQFQLKAQKIHNEIDSKEKRFFL